MYYSRGNYEAFARPLKPEGVERKTAHIIGGGLAGLATAVFLIRDGQMSGKKITIYEETNILGGACDGIEDPQKKFIFRGGREMEDHFECLWDLFKSIPSIKDKKISVLDSFYWLNKTDPNSALVRSTKNRGSEIADDGKFHLSKKSIKELTKLFLIDEDSLEDKKINEVLGKKFFESNF
jgi:oleate hydratase